MTDKITLCKYYDCGFCYAPDDVETSASPQSACFDPDYCLYLKSQMTEKEKIEGEIKILQKKLALLEELSQTKSPVEEAYKDWYGEYPITDIGDGYWEAFKAGYEVAYAISTAKEVLEEVQEDDWKPKPQTENEVAEGLRSAMRKAKEDGVFDEPKESWMDKPIDELVDMLEKNPPKCLEFQLGKTLEQLIERWWCDVFTNKKYDWDMETAIQDLCDRIFLWLPKEQDNSGTQRMETEIAVETYNELLSKIKSKIHNKR